MKDQFDNQNEIERDMQEGDIAQDLKKSSSANKVKQEKNEMSSMDSTTDIVLTSGEGTCESTATKVSIDDYSDKALAEGVISTGVFGDKIVVDKKESEEQKQLEADDLNTIYKDDEQSNLPIVTADEFEEMTNVIDGKERKQRKKKKKKTKVRKIVVRTYVTVFIAIFCCVAVYYAINFTQTAPTQGMDGAELKVDMTDLPHIVGTVGEIDLKKMFPNASEFKKNGVNVPDDNILKINNTQEFTLSYTEILDEKPTIIERKVEIKENAVNVSDWETFVSALKDKKVVCMQTAYLAAPPVAGEIKEKAMSGLTLKNDIYGNGCKLNMFEIVCCRNKSSGGKLSQPYLQGNGPVHGWSAFYVSAKEDSDEPIVMQDLQIIGNDMSTEEGGNLAGVSDVIIQKRGLKLFSGYGTLLAVEGSISNNEKANFKLKHCVLENSHKLIHVRYADMDFEGNIIRNASDTALSIATYANEKSVVRSRDNVIANSLTGGIVFYCYDGNISKDNAEDSWNEVVIEKNSFLDIYNWKLQDSLAFMPETESGAEIANPVAKSEIPKKSYDRLKADIDGKKYIHFAIIKLRTGGGLAKNGSIVKNYEYLNYQTARDKDYPNGFPLPKLASTIIKDIDVWGYYEKDDQAVKPLDTLDAQTVQRLYKELREGRVTTKA